ncbi:MAG: RNA polymerase sigma factor [Rhodobacter sp.]|nr:RNA polymerase sigma factor [Rhodobacter sp.]
MTTGDDDLAHAAAAGDSEAFAALLARHYDGLFRLSFRLTGKRDAAEDLTQDICLGLPVKLQSFHGKARFTTWLYRVAVNAAHDRRRRDATRGKAAEGWGEWEINRRAAAADTAKGLDWLQTAMTALPQELRDTAALTMGDELTQAQAAEVLGISEGTVAWRLSEIRKRLRTLREEELSA